MPFASGAFHGLRYIPEVTFGETPSTPEMIALRHTGCSLNLSKDALQSNELRDDRQISDMRHGNIRGQGGIDIEFSYAEFDAILEAALFGTFTTDVLKAGVTRKSFTIERAFADIAQYQVFTGCMVNSLSLTLRPNAMVTGSLDILAKGAAAPTGTPLDASPTASQTNSPYDGFSGAIKEGGSAISVVTGLDLSIANNLNPEFVLGSNVAAEISTGRSNVTGTLTAYFEDAALVGKFINETESSLECTLGDGTSKSYTILIPRIKYTGADNPVNGEGPVTLNMPFQALLDSVEGTNIKITRIPGV